jgi:streptogramin lyase
MSCSLITAGILASCDKQIPGIKRVYLGNFDEVSSYTLDANNVVTAIAMSPTKKFQIFEFAKETGSAGSTVNSDVPNGLLSYTHTVTLQFTKLEQSKRNKIALMALANLVAIVETNDGKYWLFGRTNGLQLSEGSSATGTSNSDFSGYTLTLTNQEPAMEIEVNSSVIPTII